MAANNLLARLVLNTEAFSSSLKKSQGEFASVNRGMQKQFGKTKKSLNFGDVGLAGSFSKIIPIAAITAGVAVLGTFSRDAMQTEGALSQLSYMLKGSSGDFLDWAKTSASAFAMSTPEAIKFGAIYGNLLRTFSKGTVDLKEKTTALIKASAIISSATTRDMSDVMERIRSGLLGNTEAIEDLGISATAAAIEQTNAFKRLGKGAKNWDSIQDNSLKQQIRYYSILEQAETNFGDKLRDNLSTKVSVLTAQFKNIKLAIGSAFLPILEKVLPIISKLVSKLEYASNALAQFSYALFGKRKKAATSAQADAYENLGNTIEGSAEQAKRGLASFDEINQISESASTAKTSPANEPIANQETENVEELQIPWIHEATDRIKAFADEVKIAFDKVKEKFFDFKDFIKDNSDVIFAALIAISVGLLIMSAPLIISALGAAFLAIRTAIGLLTSAVVKNTLAFLSNPYVWIGILVAALVYLFIRLYQKSETFRNAVDFLWASMKQLGTYLWDVFLKAMEAIANNKQFQDYFGAVKTMVSGVWDVLKGVFQFLTGDFEKGWRNIWTGLEKITRGIIVGIISLVEALFQGDLIHIVNFVIDMLNHVLKAISFVINKVGNFMGKKFELDLHIPRIEGSIASTVDKFLEKNSYGEKWKQEDAEKAKSEASSLPKALSKLPMPGPLFTPSQPSDSNNFMGNLVNGAIDSLNIDETIKNSVDSAMKSVNESSSKSGSNIVLKIDGTAIARSIAPYTAQESTRVGKSMISIK